MKTLIKTFRILNVGFLLGAAFIMWLYKDEIENNKEKNINWDRIPSSPGTEAYEPSEEFNNIYNHYKKKEKENA